MLGLKQAKCKESGIVVRFEQGKTPDEFLVTGGGKNKFGAFHLYGSFVPASGSLNVERRYYFAAQLKPSGNKKKAIRPLAVESSTPRSLPEDKPPPRVRRTPSHLAGQLLPRLSLCVGIVNKAPKTNF